jgi:hypothetical protein
MFIVSRSDGISSEEGLCSNKLMLRLKTSLFCPKSPQRVNIAVLIHPTSYLARMRLRIWDHNEVIKVQP